MTTSNGPAWLTVKDVAEELSASPMTVYRIINSGELKHLRMGARSIRIKREHLEEYLRNQTDAAAEQDPAAAYADQAANDRDVEEFLHEPDHGVFPAVVPPLATALKARGYAVPGWILAEALEAAGAAVDEARLQALRESEADQ